MATILTINDLCNAALYYMQNNMNIANLTSTYSPPTSLSSGGQIAQYSYQAQCPGVNTPISTTCYQTVYNNSDIPNAYKTRAYETIASQWNSYKTAYIDSKIPASSYISITSLIMFIYLFRCFLDTKIRVFTNIFNSASVILYNTAASSYSVSNAINTSETVLSKNTINSYVNTLIDEITARTDLEVLSAYSSGSSSCSSSSSSSCSSSSCSSSSCSSSSSWFIAFFNLR